MTLTAKETSLLKDLRSQEQLCVEKYKKYAEAACDGNLKNLFTQIGQTESRHMQMIDQISSGTVPEIGQGGQTNTPLNACGNCSPQDKQTDTYLCSDALAMEKHVSSTYNTSIFEFNDTNVRNVLNHIQKEEQQHGEKLYQYMAQNGMYQ